MPEYIRKQAVLNLIGDLEFGNAIAADYDNVHEFQKLYDAVEATPGADVEEVVHARWIEDEYAYATCSHCGYEMEHPEEKTPYCPNCGARMDGDDKPQKEIPEEYSREPGAGGWDCSDEEYNYSGYVRDVINGGW